MHVLVYNKFILIHIIFIIVQVTWGPGVYYSNRNICQINFNIVRFNLHFNNLVLQIFYNGLRLQLHRVQLKIPKSVVTQQ